MEKVRRAESRGAVEPKADMAHLDERKKRMTGMPIDKRSLNGSPLAPTTSDTVRAMLRGLRARCPNCGEAPLFLGYVTLRDDCTHCGTHLAAHRADDAPAYFTILVVGHVIIPLIFLVERQYSLETWVHMVIWLPATLFMTVAFLRPIKGGLVALQWSIGLRHDAHGYHDEINK